jgi:outer membrane autotransporter protein
MKLNNGKYGVIIANNTITAKHDVTNEGTIEQFFNFTAHQSLTNKLGAVLSVGQEAKLNVTAKIINESNANFFTFGEVKTHNFENHANVYGTGSIYLTEKQSFFNNHSGGHIAPGGGVVYMPYSDEANEYYKAYGTTTIGALTIYGTFQNGAGKQANGTFQAGGTFDITVNPNPFTSPIGDGFLPDEMKLLDEYTKNTKPYGRTDGGVAANDILLVRAVRDYNGNVLYGGDAVINGGVINVLAKSNLPGTEEPGWYVGGTRLYFLDTETGLTVNRDLVLPEGFAESMCVFDFNPKYDDYSYWLEVERRYKYGNIQGQTHNQKAVGEYIDEISKNPNPESSFFYGLVALDALSDPLNAKVTTFADRKISPEALFALDQLGGAIYASMMTASFQNITIINTQLADYLRSDPLITYCNECRVYEPAKRDFWGTVYGTLGGSDHDGNAYGYDVSTGGSMIGFDRLYINKLRAGIFGAFGNSTYTTDLLDRSKSTDLAVGFYLRKELARGYLLGSLDFGYSSYHTTRQLSFIGTRAKSDRDSYNWSLNIERGLDFATTFGRIQPYFGFQYIGNQFERFQETGAGSLSLQGNYADGQSLRSILGARFTRPPRLVKGGKLESFLNFNWKHELLSDNKGSLTAKFTQSSDPSFINFVGNNHSFKVLGNKQNRSWLDAGLGTNWDRNNTRWTMGYNIGINGDGFFMHTGNIAFIYAR